jgi:hypothetical protein
MYQTRSTAILATQKAEVQPAILLSIKDDAVRLPTDLALKVCLRTLV